MKPEIKTSPKDILDSVLGENLDPLLIWKQESQYNVDAAINYGILIDKSNGERYEISDKFKIFFKNEDN